MKKKIINMYLDYINNFLTTSSFNEYYRLDNDINFLKRAQNIYNWEIEKNGVKNGIINN